MAIVPLHTSADPQHSSAALKAGAGHFLDENGNSSHRSGPDLTQAEPIDEVIRRLASMRNAYATEFWRACQASGINVSVTRTADGEDHLQLGFPLDSQEALRKPRFDALFAQLQRGDRRKRDVTDLANILGQFADNQPFASIEEAAEEFIAAGGRIWVDTSGRCDEMLPSSEGAMAAEHWDGFPLRRLMHRYQASIRRHGGRQALAAVVCARGKTRADNGCVVLEAREP